MLAEFRVTLPDRHPPKTPKMRRTGFYFYDGTLGAAAAQAQKKFPNERIEIDATGIIF